ncbi:peptidase S8 [Virgisporangium ochraceum]|uniref:Peptidase S8 n=2 Tax=Virgisporangium ochraceum TaxID=65505 RepID=A0A8J3ZN31_9ACTN|nr:peptidase S8 [Virgisporangium ochraceum]
MSLRKRVGLRRPATVAIATAAIATMTVASSTWAQAAPAANAVKPGLYIVQFDDNPLSGYTGGISGIAATKPTAGNKLDTKTWNYDAYRKYLQSRRSDTLKRAKLNGKKPVYEYNTVFNGVAVKLTGSEVQKLRSTAGVKAVFKQEILQPQTADTPRFLGLDGPNGVWQNKFGGDEHAGEGVVVGVIDSGIWPENPSFAALPEPRPDADALADWQGECQPGEEAPFVECNNKLIGARYYPMEDLADKDYVSPRDWGGHGSHTASTAAGNHGVPAVINGEPQGNISGMAPAARIAAYKVCWETNSGAGCGTAEILAAINDAVSDGVDVINFSIGSSAQSPVLDSVELAFMNATLAGVFVAASAGNSGPGDATADHGSPWLTTVAASTHDRTYDKSVTLGNGTTYTSRGYGPALPSSPLIDSVNAGLPGADPFEVERCYSPAESSDGNATLDPAKVAGKIVLCRRGGNARTDKGWAVKEAGGVGMVMYNDPSNSVNADFQPVPTVHVDTVVGQAIKAYAATANPTASMTAAVRKKAQAPAVAIFSSRGPSEPSQGDLLKPDIAAPGVDVIAAVAPPGNHQNDFDAYSGTSMASPHIAGIAALMKQKNPTWSPMAIKSALMTTAGQTDNTGGPIKEESGASLIPSSPNAYGAGHVNPAAAYDPGLVYDSGPEDWLRWICGTYNEIGDVEGAGFNCADVAAAVGTADPSDLNGASIAVGDLAAKQTIKRTVTNTTNQASVYVPKVVAPAGYTVKVTPSVLTVLPRRSATFTVEITRTNAAFGVWQFGSLTLADLRGHSVRTPIALRAAPVASPLELSLSGTSGSKPFVVRGGVNGPLNTKVNGLVPNNVSTKRLVGTNVSFDLADPAEGPAVSKTTIAVPADAIVARARTFASEYPAGTDLDIYVYSDGELWGGSASSGTDEIVDLDPGATYDVYVVQYAVADGVTAQDVKLHSWVLRPVAAGNLTLSPAKPTVSAGAPTTLTANWSGLTPGRIYLGILQFGQGGNLTNATVVTART